MDAFDQAIGRDLVELQYPGGVLARSRVQRLKDARAMTLAPQA